MPKGYLQFFPGFGFESFVFISFRGAQEKEEACQKNQEKIAIDPDICQTMNVGILM